MQRRFATLDVFTNRRLTGNPLAVVLDAEGLETEAMQAIAREFGHPETVFVFAPEQAANRARLRIFTPTRELAFAGHPTVGTAALLGLRDGVAAGQTMVLEEKLGPVPCVFEKVGADQAFVRFTAPQAPTELGPAADAGALAKALGLSPSDIGFGAFRPSRFSVGSPFTFVPVAGLTAIGRCRVDPAAFASALGENALAYVFCGETVSPEHQFHARMFAPSVGIPEDPATGSAAAAFPGVIAKFGAREGRHTIRIEQGYEMGRPSVIEITLEVTGGTAKAALIGGDAIVVTTGMIEA